MKSRCCNLSLVLLVVALIGFWFSTGELIKHPHYRSSEQLRVSLPVPIQLVSAMGDRYLAANLAYFRALLVTAEKLDQDGLHVLARIQSDVAILNPAHEDNYYIGAAVLSWNNELPAADFILERATVARPFDWLPPFLGAFNQFQFHGNATKAAMMLHQYAAPRAKDQGDRYLLDSLAARWVERGQDPSVAIQLIQGMIHSARDSGFKRYLQSRLARMEAIRQVQAAVNDYKKQLGGTPVDISQLIFAGFLKSLPNDPLGGEFQIKPDGRVVIEMSAK